MLTFLNVALLGGLAAGAIPIIIHLLNRTRFRIMPWGAMHLLENVLRLQRRRLKIEQLILMAIRTAIPLLLALCMARPVLTGMRALLGNAKASMVVLFDSSFSMNGATGARSRLAQGREEASTILTACPSGSEASVIWMEGSGEAGASEVTGPTFDVERLQRSLLGKETGFGIADPGAAIDTAAGLLSLAHYANREVVIVSDYQRTSWAGFAAAAKDKGKEQAKAPKEGEPGKDDAPPKEAATAPLLKNDRPGGATGREGKSAVTGARGITLLKNLLIPPRVILLRAGSETPDNVAVESLDLSRTILGVGQRIQVRANLRNYGRKAFTDMRVYFRVDGQERSASQITLEPGQNGQALFTHSFDKAGSHVIEVYAEADPLKEDNIRRASVAVWDHLPVLLISGETSGEPLKGATGYLEIALQPYMASGSRESGLSDLIQTQLTSSQSFNPKDLKEARVAVLANAPQLTDSQLQTLEDFVREGGGLLIFPGDRVNAEWHNSRLHRNGEGLLPCRLANLAGSLKEDERPAEIVAQRYNHPVLSLFNDPRNGNLGGGKIRMWYELKTPEFGLTAGDNFAVMARLDSGDPFLVEKEFGAGRVIQCCVSCDSKWSNLPLQPAYLPLMQQLVTYLASKVTPSRNIELGQRLMALLPKELSGKKASLTDPEGKKFEIAIKSLATHSVAEFSGTTRPGLYILDPPGSGPDQPGSLRIHYVVSTPPSESDLTSLSGEEMTVLAKEMGATAVSSAAEYAQLERQRRFGREVWKPLLALLLILIFLELFLEQYFTRVKDDRPTVHR